MFFSSRHRATALPVSLVDIWWDCCLLNAARVCVANKNNLDCGSVFFLFFFFLLPIHSNPPPPKKKQKTQFWVSSLQFSGLRLYHFVMILFASVPSAPLPSLELWRLNGSSGFPWSFDSNTHLHVTTQLEKKEKKKKSRLFCLWFPQISERNHWATASHELWQWELLFAPGFGPVSPTGGDLLGAWILFFFVISFWLYCGRCDYCFLFSLLLE